MGLNLYSKIESYLDFQTEVHKLHSYYMYLIMTNKFDNIIDIGCGQGFFMENLKINDKKYFGIDLSEEQIKVCEQKKLNAACVSLEAVKEKFSCATAIFDVLNYIKKKDLKDFFMQTYNVLDTDGCFIFDINTLYGFDQVAQGCVTIDMEEKFIAIDAYFKKNKLKTNLTLFSKKENGFYEKEEGKIKQYYHKNKFLEKILKEVGFKKIEIRDFNLHTEKIPDKHIYICHK